MKAIQMGVVLRGDRNQCTGCDELFNSTHAFEKHRVGEHGISRRCLTIEEMKEKKMFCGQDGFWRGSAMPTNIREIS
jgi:hypothetical protein